MPAAIASISSGSITLASRYRGTPAASLAACNVARSRSCTKSGSPIQVSRRDRFGSFMVTAMPILSPNASITRSQYRANSAGASGSSQPPRIANQWGEVKWLKVTIGCSPSSWQRSRMAS